ncbi:MAG: hypothetical protein HQK78_00940 [Desulfobacterales bacterium]|nr:hypothetical protein [Desulfobacterales bacterium]
MIIYDDIFSWEGWGGKLRLGSGKCRMRIYDFKKDGTHGLAYLKPIIVVVSDVCDSKLSIKSCAGHIATILIQEFNIDPHKMLFIEYCPKSTYGINNEHIIPESYDIIEFTWHEDKAINPKWRSLPSQIIEKLQEFISKTG